MSKTLSPWFALLVPLGTLVFGTPLFFDERADLRPGDSGKTLYRTAALLSALAAATIFVAHLFEYWHHPLQGLATIMGAMRFPYEFPAITAFMSWWSWF